MLSPFSRQALSLALFATLSAACTTDDDSVGEVEVDEPTTVEQSLEQRTGSVLVEFNAVEADGISVHAQFLAVRGVSTQAALDALDVWTPDSELDLDTCSIQVPPSTGEEAGAVRLHLLDVGPIAVSALDRTIRLEGRRVPDLRSFSGVVYGNEEGFDIDEAHLPFEPQARYQILAPGGAEAGGFNVSLLAPSVPEIETVTGQYAVDASPIELRGDDLELRWSSVHEENTQLFLELRSGVGAPRLSCRVEDDGTFVVPATVLDQLDAGGPIELTLRRVDTLDLPIDRVDDVAFVFASTAKAAVNP